jgi:small subunit ribosomal protein S20
MAKLKTGRHTGALKEKRKAISRRIRNTSQKSSLHTLVKKIEAAVAKKEEAVLKDLLKAAFSALDKAARNNVIHKNKAANQKARLSKLAKSISGQGKK